MACRLRISATLVLLLFITGCRSHDSSKQTVAPQPNQAQPVANTTPPAAAPIDQTWQGRQLIYPEVEAKARELGPDLSRILQFTTNELKYDAYAGALRGPRGVLLAGAGSATDKSLLMRDLIRTATPNTILRFAYCSLPSNDAQQLVAQAIEERDSNAAKEAAAPSHASMGRAPASAHTRMVAQQVLTAWRKVVQDARHDANSLHAVLERAEIPTVADFDSQKQQLIAAATQHVWLQYRQGNDWVDLDPTLGEMGKHRCIPESTSEVLPETAYHHVGISVRVEEEINNTLKSRYLLQTFWRSAELSGSNITYTHAESIGLDSLVKSVPPAGYYQFTPLLSMDDEYVLGDSFLLPGAHATKGGVQRYSNAVAGGFGALGNALSGVANAENGSTASSTAPSGEVTALWLQFDLRAPDGTTKTIDWPIFDRIGYVARSYGEEDSTPLAAPDMQEGALDHLASLWNIATWSGETDVPQSLSPATGETSDLWAALDSVGTLHHGYYPIRSRLFDAITPDHKGRYVATSPSLSVMTIHAAADNSNAVTTSMDRVEEAPLFVGASGGPNSALWAAASVEAERFTVASPSLVSGEMNPRSALPDAASVLRAAEDRGISLRLLQPKDATHALELDASDEARTRIYFELSGGDSVIMPEKAVLAKGASGFGWWTLYAKSGDLNDEMESGSHQAAAEYGEEEEESAAEAEQPRRLANRMCKLIAYSAFAIASIAATKSGNPLDIADAINKGLGLTKKENDCKEKQKRPKGKTPKVKGAAPPPKPPKPPRRPPGPPPKARPPAPNPKMPPPLGKDRYGWGPRNPERWGTGPRRWS